MKHQIDKNYVKLLKNSQGGQFKVDLEEVEKIYRHLDDKSCRVILLDKMCFILFDEIPHTEFAISEFKKLSDINFINSSDIEVVDTSKKDGNYFLFLMGEFIQGKSFWKKFWRFFQLLIPLVLLNVFGYLYADKEGINEVFNGLLTAVSIFIAIFSLFVTSHDYLTRKKIVLFESGQLSYYFSVDKYITQTGVYAILMSVLGLIATSSADAGTLYSSEIENIIIITLMNLVFISVYIILRSMIEFYIVRPGRFILADMKAQSVADYWKSNQK